MRSVRAVVVAALVMVVVDLVWLGVFAASFTTNNSARCERKRPWSVLPPFFYVQYIAVVVFFGGAPPRACGWRRRMARCSVGSPTRILSSPTPSSKPAIRPGRRRYRLGRRAHRHGRTARWLTALIRPLRRLRTARRSER